MPSPLRLIAREGRVVRFPVLKFSAFPPLSLAPFFLSLSLSRDLDTLRVLAPLFSEKLFNYLTSKQLPTVTATAAPRRVVPSMRARLRRAALRRCVTSARI